MASEHSVEILLTGSPYIGRTCPAAKTELGAGERVVICHKKDEIFSWAALPDLEGRCPHCGNPIDLGEILIPPRQHSEKPDQPGKREKGKPQPKPDYVPAQRRNSVPLVLVALAVLGLIGICGIGGVIGYRQFFVQSTSTPTAALVVAQATKTPSEPTKNLVPTTLIRDQVVNVIRRFNADQTTAVQELNLDILRDTCTGRCFMAQREYMEQLIRDNLYEVQEQLNFEVLNIDVSGNTAEVVTTETWRTAKYDRSTHECRYHQPTFVTQQTYTLVREGGTWKISWDNFDTPAPADIPGC
jgi:hypothetical protein